MTLTPGGVGAGAWIDDGTRTGLTDSRRHGPVRDVYPYRCSPAHGCDRSRCDRSRWWVVRYLDGTEVTESNGRPVGETITWPTAGVPT